MAGAVVLAAGVYELTPLKRHFRWRCRESFDSGFGFGAYCVGSSIGLMAMMAAMGVVSVTWMAVIAVLVLGQKRACRQSRDRHSARARDRRIRASDHRGPVFGSRAPVADVRVPGLQPSRIGV